nr:MAG TPA: hypothetical protein [Caudoviricetes sp.]
MRRSFFNSRLRKRKSSDRSRKASGLRTAVIMIRSKV